MNRIALIGIMVLSIIIILLFSPVNHPNLQLNEEEKVTCRRSVRWLMLLVILCIGSSIIMNINQVLPAYAIAAVGMDAGLILIAKLCRQEVSYEEAEG